MQNSFDLIPLGGIAHIEMGQSPDSSSVFEGIDGGLPFLQGNADFGVSHPIPRFRCIAPGKVCQAGDILISVRAPVGALNIADRAYCIGRGLAAIRIVGMPSSLTAQLVSAAAPALQRVAQGTTFDAINRSDLERLVIGNPPSVEQDQLTLVFDALDTTICQTEAIIEKLKLVKQGLLHDLLTRGIDANGELRPPQSQAPHLYKDSPLGRIPITWTIRAAHDVCEAIIDCKNRTPPETEVGHPVIRTPNVRDGRFVRNNLLFTDSRSYDTWTQRGKPLVGDVLITREAPFGEVCLLPADIGSACLGQRMMMYRPAKDILSNEFMVIALSSMQVKKTLIDLAGGSTVGHVRVGDIRRLPIQIPPLDEQLKIAASLHSLMQRLEAEEVTLAKVNKQKSGLMDDLLTGRVRVTPLLTTVVA